MSIMLLHAVINSMEVHLPHVAKSSVEPGTEYFSARMRSMPAGFLISHSLEDIIKSGKELDYGRGFQRPQLFLHNLQNHVQRTIKRIVNKTSVAGNPPMFLRSVDLTDYLQAVDVRGGPGSLKFGRHGEIHNADDHIQKHIRLQAAVMAEHTSALRELLLFAGHSFDNAQYSQTNDAEAHGIIAYTVMTIALNLIRNSETIKFLSPEVAADVKSMCSRIESGFGQFANMYAAFGYNMRRMAPTDVRAWAEYLTRAWTGYLTSSEIFLSNAYKSMLEYADSAQFKTLKIALDSQLEQFLMLVNVDAMASQTLHKTTEQLLEKQFNAIRVKLLDAQLKHNLVNGWRMPSAKNLAKSGDGRFFTDAKTCAIALVHHMHKGDLQDIIIYSMYLQELLAEEGKSLSDVIEKCNTRTPKGSKVSDIKWRVRG